MLLDVHVQPGAKHDEVIGAYGNRLKLRIAARPANNAANQRLAAFLAKEFGVPGARVRLVLGPGRRQKRVAIEQPTRMPGWLQGGAE